MHWMCKFAFKNTAMFVSRVSRETQQQWLQQQTPAAAEGLPLLATYVTVVSCSVQGKGPCSSLPAVLYSSRKTQAPALPHCPLLTTNTVAAPSCMLQQNAMSSRQWLLGSYLVPPLLLVRSDVRLRLLHELVCCGLEKGTFLQVALPCGAAVPPAAADWQSKGPPYTGRHIFRNVCRCDAGQVGVIDRCSMQPVQISTATQLIQCRHES